MKNKIHRNLRKITIALLFTTFIFTLYGESSTSINYNDSVIYRTYTDDVIGRNGRVLINSSSLEKDSLGNEIVIDGKSNYTGLTIKEYMNHFYDYHDRIIEILNEKDIHPDSLFREWQGWYEDYLNLDKIDELRETGYDVFYKQYNSFGGFQYVSLYPEIIVIGKITDTVKSDYKKTQYYNKSSITVTDYLKGSEYFNKSLSFECLIKADIIPNKDIVMCFLIDYDKNTKHGIPKLWTWFDINEKKVTSTPQYRDLGHEMPLSEFISKVKTIVKINDEDNFYKRSWKNPASSKESDGLYLKWQKSHEKPRFFEMDSKGNPIGLAGGIYLYANSLLKDLDLKELLLEWHRNDSKLSFNDYQKHKNDYINKLMNILNLKNIQPDSVLGSISRWYDSKIDLYKLDELAKNNFDPFPKNGFNVNSSFEGAVMVSDLIIIGGFEERNIKKESYPPHISKIKVHEILKGSINLDSNNNFICLYTENTGWYIPESRNDILCFTKTIDPSNRNIIQYKLFNWFDIQSENKVVDTANYTKDKRIITIDDLKAIIKKFNLINDTENFYKRSYK